MEKKLIIVFSSQDDSSIVEMDVRVESNTEKKDVMYMRINTDVFKRDYAMQIMNVVNSILNKER